MADMGESAVRDYTHPDVLAAILAGEPWADPTMDPTAINWAVRQAAALIPFRVIDGRPLNPAAPTGIRYGRNELGHWGEQQAADTIVTLVDDRGQRRLLMIERADGHGWAVPGGYVDPGERAVDTALRELAEETGLVVRPGVARWVLAPRYVPDPRASDEAWMVTTPVRVDLGWRTDLPAVTAADDANRAEWIPADTHTHLTHHLSTTHGAAVFAAHRQLLADLLP